MLKKCFAIAILGIQLVSISYAQTDSWGAPSDNAAAWGGRTDDLNPIAPRNVHKLDREQHNPLNDSVLKPTSVANPFDENGVYIGESQVMTGEGIDPSTGQTIVDTPRD